MTRIVVQWQDQFGRWQRSSSSWSRSPSPKNPLPCVPTHRVGKVTA
jgi:hypothetical protein